MSRSYELSAACFWLRLEAVAQLAGKYGASLGREGQCGPENVRGSALHGPDLSSHRVRATPTKNDKIAPSHKALIVELLTPRGGPRQKAVVVAPNRSAKAEEALRRQTEERRLPQ